jgi:V/A-type H+-transporting ATPase subunit I
MFPDVGHGLLLALFAALMYRRWPDGRFLIPCGLSAAAFGVVFGEVFGMEGVLEPLWIKPMEHPLLVLAIPMVFGVGLMLLGLVFTGIEAHWRNEIGAWLRSDAAVLVIYAAALVGLCCLRAYWAAAAALLWFLLGQLATGGGRRIANLLRGIGHLLQSVFELALNTFSFLRVGAFALAHAGLSSAILGLAGGIEETAARIVFLIIGHTLVVAVEGLVVFVQTTRLVLFEFFIRFLQADGRVFRPLPLPPDHAVGGKTP